MNIFNKKHRELKKLFVNNLIKSLNLDTEYWSFDKFKNKYISVAYETKHYNYIIYNIQQKYYFFYLINITKNDENIFNFIIIFNLKFIKSFKSLCNKRKKLDIDKKYAELFIYASHQTKNKPTIQNIRKEKLDEIK